MMISRKIYLGDQHGDARPECITKTVENMNAADAAAAFGIFFWFSRAVL